MVEPFHYTDQEVEEHRREGTRPPLGSILSIWWAHDTAKDEKWRRESRAWDLKSLIHIYSTRYTFKYIYSLWCSLPLAIEAKQRGKDAPGSATKTRNLRRTEAHKEASSFLAALGLDKPTDKEEWRTVLREMGSFLATKVFLTNCPAPVMEMPVAPVRDSKEAMRFRAICDERITIPLDALKQFPEVHSKLVGQLPQSAMVDVKVNWRCNVTHTWAAEVPASEAYPLYAKLHYSRDTILALGCTPPPGVWP